MKIKATQTLKLLPIGDITFIFNSKSKRKGKKILISDVTILNNTDMDIDEASEMGLLREMKEKGSSLLCDGRRFYTTFGNHIKQIEHPQFQREFDMHQENMWANGMVFWADQFETE